MGEEREREIRGLDDASSRHEYIQHINFREINNVQSITHIIANESNGRKKKKGKTIFCLCVVTCVLVTVYFLHAQRISLSLQLKTTRDKTG